MAAAALVSFLFALAQAMLGVPVSAAATAQCGSDTATIVGTNKGEVLEGTAGKDVIVAKGGNDTIRGLKGSDVLCGNDGKDKILGAGGNEIARGGGGNDQIEGGGGKDNLFGGAGDDTLKGGEEADRLIGGGGTDRAEGGPGLDACVAETEISCNAPPVAVADSYLVTEEQALSVPAPGVLDNDSDADGHGLSAVRVAGPSNGNLTLNGDGSFDYTLDPNFSGSDSFTYRADDGTETSAAATVTIDVTAVNDAPVLANLEESDLSFTEDDAPTLLTSALTVSDDGTLALATVQITSNYDSGEDALSFTGNASTGSITGAFDSDTGTLTLTGPGTPQEFQAALRRVRYANSSQDPSTATRTVSMQVDDGEASDNLSNAVSRNIAVAAINDAPALAGIEPTALTYTEDSPTENHLLAATSTLTVGDADHVTLSSATVAITNNYQNGQDLLALTPSPQNGITGSFDATTGVLTLSGSSTVANYQAALRAVTYRNTSEAPSVATRTLSYQVTDPASTASNTVTRNVTVVPTNDAPTPDNETFSGNNSALSNTRLDNGTSAAGPKINVGTIESVTAGDTDVDGDTLAIVAGADCTGSAPFSCTTDNGGTVSLQAGGLFSYVPPPGFTGTDSFQYRVSDGQRQPNSEANANVTINVVGPRVWYVDDSASSGGNGTSTAPFQGLGPLSTGGGSDTLDGAGDLIFVYAGTYTNGIVLENNQKLIGQPHSLDVTDTLARTHTDLVAAGGTAPAISHAGSPVVTLASGNELQDLALGNGTVSLTGSNVGTVTLADSSINNTSGKAVDISTGTLAMTFTAVSSSGSASDGIRLDNTAGTFTAFGGSLQNAIDQDVDISGNNAADTVNFTYNGSITDETGQLVSIANQNGGIKDFNSAISDGNAASSGGGIALTSNTGATIRFDGGLTLATGSNAAFAATGGGTVFVTGPSNTIDTTSGTALNVTSTDVGSTPLTFQRISSNGAPTGILLSNTGPNPSLTVTGSGGTCTTRPGAPGVRSETAPGPITAE